MLGGDTLNTLVNFSCDSIKVFNTRTGETYYVGVNKNNPEYMLPEYRKKMVLSKSFSVSIVNIGYIKIRDDSGKCTIIGLSDDISYRIDFN